MAKGEITHIEFPADDTERAKRVLRGRRRLGVQRDRGDARATSCSATARARAAPSASRGESTGQRRPDLHHGGLAGGRCAAAAANGGTVVEQPADIGGGMGRWAVVRDTEGSEVGLWQASPS